MRALDLRVAAGCLVGLSVCGCGTFLGPESPYLPHYESAFQDIGVPTAAVVAEHGIPQPIARAAEDVWSAAIQVASRTRGVLGIREERDGTRVILLVHGREFAHKVPGGKTNSEDKVILKFKEEWLALSVEPAGSESTLLHVAWIAPETARVAPMPGPEPLYQKPANKKPSRYDLQKSVEDTLLAPSAQEAAARDVLYAVEAQLNAEAWRERLTIQSGPRAALTSEPELSPLEPLELSELEVLMGNWFGASWRRTYVSLECPLVEAAVLETAHRVLAGAGWTFDDLVVHVYANPSPNAYVSPSGEILISSGMMERIKDPHMLAALLAHELDHLVGHDAEDLLRARQEMQVVAGAVAAGAILATGPLGAGASTSGALPGLMTSQQIFTLAAIQGAGMMVPGQLGVMMLGGFSRKREMEADATAWATLKATGYDPVAQIDLLRALKEYQDGAPDRNQQEQARLRSARIERMACGNHAPKHSAESYQERDDLTKERGCARWEIVSQSAPRE